MSARALAAALGVRHKGVPNAVTFKPVSRGNLWAAGIGVTTKSAAIIVAYVRDGAHTDAASMQRFADKGCHELRREGPQGRNVLRSLIGHKLQKGDALMVASLRDLANGRDLPNVIREIEAKGIRIISLDGADSASAKGQEKIASTVLASKQLFGLRL